MCGIAGLIGKTEVYDTLVDYLKKLEYRGYDSAGIAVVKNDGNLSVVKRAGAVKNLEGQCEYNGKTGIAHTRWATHGKPSEINAHPHLSQGETWAAVHNGIIENYAEIKSGILSGVQFKSQTDSEVVPNLFEKFALDGNITGVSYALSLLKGSYAIAAIRRGVDEIVAAADKSPLFVGKTDKGTAVCSDPIIFSGAAYELLNGEICIVRSGDLAFYNRAGEKINKSPVKLDVNFLSDDLNGYEHYMRKEIAEIPEVIARLSQVYTKEYLDGIFSGTFLGRFTDAVVIGCGTAYNAACYGREVLTANLKINARSAAASEFLYGNEVIGEHTLFVAVSQSGETADTLGAVKAAKSKGAFIVGVTNVTYSALARISDAVLPVYAGREVSVASTKAYVAQICVLYILAKYLSGKTADISLLVGAAETLEKGDYSSAFDICNFAKKLFVLGRGLDYYLAEESALKIKEVAYINANAYMSGELKHGFIALIDENSAVVVYCTQKRTYLKCVSCVEEVLARGAKVVLITPFEVEPSLKSKLAAIIKIPDAGDDELNPLTAVIPWQIISYKAAISRGYNPDKPRNLAKSVTVE